MRISASLLNRCWVHWGVTMTLFELQGTSLRKLIRVSEYLPKSSVVFYASLVSILLRTAPKKYCRIIRWACTNGHLGVLRVLVDHKINIASENEDALGKACEAGQRRIVDFLLEHKANVTANRNSAIRAAKSANHPDLVELLVEHKADITQADQTHELSLEEICREVFAGGLKSETEPYPRRFAINHVDH